MAPLDRSRRPKASYWSANVSVALFCTIFTLFDVEKCGDKVTGNSTIRWIAL